MAYVQLMHDRAAKAFDALHRGVDELHFTDFPDHHNAGDSAIALGQATYWRRAGIQVHTTSSTATRPERVYRSEIPVLIQGGGNLGGLYPILNESRYRLAERLPSQTLLLQAPQSVTFADERQRRDTLERFASRPSLRVAVRDNASLSLLRDHVGALSLAPDAVHLLGRIEAPDPVRERIVLARRDPESSLEQRPAGSHDWRQDPVDLRAHQWAAWRASSRPALKPLFERDHAVWMRRAERRFRAAVGVLSTAETIVTDRLHAMLIGLQMGREVIAVDNNNKKLSNYAETWFDDADPRLRFATAAEAFRD